jgi:hypothetical protein
MVLSFMNIGVSTLMRHTALTRMKCWPSSTANRTTEQWHLELMIAGAFTVVCGLASLRWPGYDGGACTRGMDQSECLPALGVQFSA